MSHASKHGKDIEQMEAELNQWRLAFAHAIMRNPVEAFSLEVDGKTIEQRAIEWFNSEITIRNIASTRTRQELLEAWDLVAIMAKNVPKYENELASAYNTLAWVMGSNAEFEKILEAGREFLAEQGAVVYRSLYGEPPRQAKDYRIKKERQ